jgi:hypothetical protein
MQMKLLAVVNVDFDIKDQRLMKSSISSSTGEKMGV